MKLLCGYNFGGGRGFCYRLADHPFHRGTSGEGSHPFIPIGEEDDTCLYIFPFDGFCGNRRSDTIHKNPERSDYHLFDPKGSRVYPTIETFLDMRLSEARQVCGFLGGDHFKKVVTLLSQMQDLLEFHKNWPVLVTTEPEIRGTVPLDANAVTYSISQKIEWLTQQEYKKKFGTEPPTAPLLLKMASYYSNHKDFNPDWTI